MKFKVKTFGCKLNQYESEKIIDSLCLGGAQYCRDEKETADLLVVNSCTVTAKSDAKLKSYVRKQLREYPDTKIILSGCYANLNKDAFKDEKVSVVESGNIEEIQNIALNSEESRNTAGPLLLSDYREHSRAFLKVQDGCAQFCNYCIVAYARGKVRSTDSELILNAIKELIDKGFSEIVFTGVNLGAYKNSGLNLAALVRKAQPLFNGRARLRFSSIEPLFFSDELISLFEENYICNHAHIPLQSGSAETLKNMGRKYSPEEYAGVLAKLRERVPNIAVSTDIMAGHPGETDEDFEECLNFAERAGFSKIHTFRYSKRPGTPSADMPRQIPEKLKKERAKSLAELDERLQLKYRKMMLGKEIEAVVEKGKGETSYAIGSEYLRFRVESNEKLLPRSLIRGTFCSMDGEENVLYV